MSHTGGRGRGARARVLRAAAGVALTRAFAELCAFALIRGHIAPHYPLATLDGRDDVLRAFDVAKRHDYWYQNRVLRNEFPFVLDAGRLFLILSGLRPSPRYDQWDNEDAKSRLATAIDAFVREAAQRDITPVLLVIPSWRDVRGRTNGVIPRSKSFFEASRARHEGSG